ncbi:hypothetical protein OKA04_20580 [Luteolibacter flavescens]|uniref:DUF1559 domain-containing protein n=1 Tax=Luteolibacter flavescens TaxID=1859460 RepID=A0ABT3FUC0_9BACT|nr:hypothetical protein [Luteolibacter flavescens]MCW1887147.1 hypothetical protein [Luteolibacter flavescens]
MNATLPPQPPPDAPPPPPGTEAEKSRRKMKWILRIGGGCLLLSVLAGLANPKIVRSSTKSDQVEASQNIRQVYVALLDFESEFGTFPDGSTISAVQSRTSTPLSLGKGSSNEMFRQLIAYRTTTSESIFWAKTSDTRHKPDNVLGNGALKKGECSFTYIAGLSTSSDPTAPLMMAPVIRGTWQFDPKSFVGIAVVIHVDGSVKPYPIDQHGDVMIGGMSIFDPRQPYWRGKGPDIKWPE